MSKIFHLALLFSLFLLIRAEIDTTQWELFLEDTLDFAVGERNAARLFKHKTIPGVFVLQSWDWLTQKWKDYPIQNAGGAVKLKFSADSNNIFILGKDKRIYYAPFRLPIGPIPLWKQYGNAYVTDFDVSDPSGLPIWFIETAGKRVYKEARPQWMGAFAEKIAVESTGKAWIVTTNGDILSYVGFSWTLPSNNGSYIINQGSQSAGYFVWLRRPGKATNIMMGPGDIPYIASQDATEGGFTIKKWNPAVPGSWETIPGIGGVSVSLESDTGIMYVITNDNKVYRQKGKVSRFCPMCAPNCQAPECPSHEESCFSFGCINCPPRTVVATQTSPNSASCEACPIGCQTCSSPTTCIICEENFYLAPDGTCLISCDAPLVDYTDEAGNLHCKGPCADDDSDVYYYPSDNTCQATCSVPIPNPGAFYESCDY